MSENDIETTGRAIVERIVGGMMKDRTVGPDEVRLVEAAGALLTGYLVDTNRIANALEAISGAYLKEMRRPGR
jgi:hypothetical protein